MLQLRENGYNVGFVAPRDIYTSLLEAEGFKFVPWYVNRQSLNPINEFKALLNLWTIYHREKPCLVHHFTIKACLYGTIAAKGARVYRVINAITGLGHVFIGTRKRSVILRKIIMPLYKAAFTARRSIVIFQNASDQEKLIQLGIADDSRSRLIRGSGVDVNYFKPSPDKYLGHFRDPIQLLFPSRLIREKGIRELLAACKSLWSQGVNLELLIAGELDRGNRSALSDDEINHLQGNLRVRCLGHVDDMRSLYSSSDIVVLPSWREGLSRSLIEAAAMERPIITTDVPGCRDVVDHGLSGLLVPVRDARSIQLAIRLLLENPSLARSLGKAARLKVVSEFQVMHVNQSTISQYHQLLDMPLCRDNRFQPVS